MLNTTTLIECGFILVGIIGAITSAHFIDKDMKSLVTINEYAEASLTKEEISNKIKISSMLMSLSYLIIGLSSASLFYGHLLQLSADNFNLLNESFNRLLGFYSDLQQQLIDQQASMSSSHNIIEVLDSRIIKYCEAIKNLAS